MASSNRLLLRSAAAALTLIVAGSGLVTTAPAVSAAQPVADVRTARVPAQSSAEAPGARRVRVHLPHRHVIRGEWFQISGVVPGAGERVVLIKERKPRREGWARTIKVVSDATGAFSAKMEMRGRLGSGRVLRVFAPEAVVDGVTWPDAVSDKRFVRFARQVATLRMPSTVRVGDDFDLVASVTPARQDRAVRIERWTGTAWVPFTEARTTRYGIATVPATAAALGSHTFRARAASFSGSREITSADAAVTIRVAAGSPAKNPDGPALPPVLPPVGGDPVIATASSLPAAETGTPYQFTFTVADDVQGTWSTAAALPDGMTLTPAGVLSGSPTTAGTHTVTVTFTDTWGRQVAKDVTFTVASPLPPAPVTAAVVSVAGKHSCAVRKDGTLWCWGVSWLLGQSIEWQDAAPARVDDPVQVGTDTDWVFVAAGEGNTCAIKADQSLWCWGDNWTGEAGQDPALDWVDEPARVGTDSDWETVAVTAWEHTCGVKTDGSAWCWGRYEGHGSGTNSWQNTHVPQRVVSATAWSSVQTAAEHSCAVKQGDRSLWCWGEWDGGFDQTSNPNPYGVVFTAPVLSDGAAWTDHISLSVFAGCGVREDASLWCWSLGGDHIRFNGSTGSDGWAAWTYALPSGNVYSDFGDALYSGEPTMQQIHNGGSWLDVFVEDELGCGIKADHTLWCWGYHHAGPGYTNGTVFGHEPVAVMPGLALKSIRVGARAQEACGVTLDEDIHCFNPATGAARRVL